MNERFDIQFGQAFATNLQDEDGYADLTGATAVVLQYRSDCGTITDLAGVLVDGPTGSVSVSGAPVGDYQSRWKITIGATDTYYPDYDWDNLVVRAVDECTTFELFVSNVAQTIFPEGEAENLIAGHRKYIVDGLIDLQQKIPCLRTSHRDRRGMANTYLECGATVTDAPRGFISDVYAVKQTDCCSKRRFIPIEYDEMIAILQDQKDCGYNIEPTLYYIYDEMYVGYPDYGCLYYGDSSGATDFRSRPGVSYVAMKNGLLYLYPYLQSYEVLVVEWDGIKRSWKDTDEVTFDRELQDAVEHFLDWKSKKREDCDLQKLQIAKMDYEELVKKLIWQCRKETRLERRVHYFTNCCDFCNSCASSNRTNSANQAIEGLPLDLLMEPAVNNYTDLRTIADPRIYKSVKVLGYASAFDGGGGIFIRESNSPVQIDNDGDIVLSTLSLDWYWRKWL